MVLVSDNNMEDLLAQLKAEFEPKRKAIENNSSSVSKSKQPPQNNSSSSSMDGMLNELREELESARRGNNQATRSSQSPQPAVQNNNQNNSKYRDRLNVLIEQDYQMQARKREAKRAEIRKQEAARIAEEKRRQQELIAARKREELREINRKKALREKAKLWLKNLNPRSEEGKWFQEFAYSYENKLDAAVDYLEAMRESGL